MGRKLKRKLERNKRIAEKKESVQMTYQELNDLKRKTAEDQNAYTVDNMCMLFALAEHRIHKFGYKRIFRTLNYIETLMDPIIKGEKTFEEYAKELEEETKIKVR